MRRLSGALLAAVVSAALATPASAQDDSWMNKWYWGAQVGTFIFSTPTVSNATAFDVGGHWLITGERVGLHLSLDQIFFSSSSTSAISDATAPNGVRTVGFTSGRRLQGELYAIPSSGALQIFAGGGLAIHQVTDAAAQGTFASPIEQDAVTRLIDDVSTKAFFVVSAGAQWRWGKWAAFGKYQFMPEGRDFLISSEQHAITGGLRYILANSNEDITTER